MAKILFLDDDRDRHKRFMSLVSSWNDVTEVWTASDACDAMREQSFDVAFLDHDLCPEDVMCSSEESLLKNGTHVARFIVDELDEGSRPKRIVVHSWNRPAAEGMVSILSAAGIDVVYAPFGLW